MSFSIIQADAIDFLRSQPAGSLDLVFGSPPYERARLYLEGGENLGIARDTEAWVAWMEDVYRAALHACKGLVAFVTEGQTRDFRYSAGPLLLAADLHRSGITLRKPPIFHRVGISGSGGPDWLRNDYEFVLCATNGGKLAWSDNTACGTAQKFAVGGAMSYRNAEGQRYNHTHPKMLKRNELGRDRKANSTSKTRTDKRIKDGARTGEDVQNYHATAIANPGNVLSIPVGGGKMGGDQFSSQNEAPFPERLAEFFILSFARPNGLVCDPFSGSGTTAAVSVRHGRRFTGCDLRKSQVSLSRKRVSQETPLSLLQP